MLPSLSKLYAFQDSLVRLLGASVPGRAVLVAGMLSRTPAEATAYWLQLLVAIGIATLGLVVGSAAVVIGAMLVAPLMGPIVHLAMGLAAGSPFLVLRSAGRIVLSVAAAVGGAALITLVLPFHELNAEIAARTAPTVLDLATAAFCALAGVYATLRASSDTVSTAAGTSIGISLVPPLCASGYGFGTGAWGVAGGAALLFLTNLVAIIAVGTLAFVAAGFARIDVLALERAELARDAQGARLSRTLARRLEAVFASGWGPALRFLMPFALLATVYVPLRSALDEVAWQVRVRTALRAFLDAGDLRVVTSRVRVERHQVELSAFILGGVNDAVDAKSKLDVLIRQVAGVAPRLEVVAVADADALSVIQSSLVEPVVAVVPKIPPIDAETAITRTHALLSEALESVWPSERVGAVARTELTLPATSEDLTITVTHFGVALAPDAREAIARALSRALERAVRVEDVALPKDPIALPTVAQALPLVVRLLEMTRTREPLRVCVTRPLPAPDAPAPRVAGKGATPAPTPTPLEDQLGQVLRDAGHAEVMDADGYSVWVASGRCSAP